MNLKRVAAMILVCVIVMAAVGGCTSSQQNSDVSGGEKSGASTDNSGGSEDKQTDEKAKLLYTYWGSAFEKEAQAAAIEKFNEENPDVVVEALHIPASGSQYVAKLTAMVASGTNPDVGYMDVPTAFVWAKEGKFYDIFELIEKDPEWSKDKYVDDIFYMYEENKSFGTLSSINPRAIFYNKDCFTEAGIELPPDKVENAWTWDQFVEVAKKLTIDMNGKTALDPDFDPNRIRQYGIYLNPTDLATLSIFFDSNGVDLLTEDGTKLALDDPAAKEVLQLIHDLIYVHHVAPVPTDFANMPDGPTWLKNKQAAMFITGQWVLLDIAKLNFNYGIGVLPKIKESRNIKDAGVRVIFKNTKYPEKAWELYKFLANPAGALSLYKDGLWMPVLREWYENEELFGQWGKDNPAHPDSYKTAVADSLFDGTSTPSWALRISNFAELNSVINPALQQVWLDSKSVDEVVDEIMKATEGMVQGYNPGYSHNSAYR